uniref:Uncharacterized protein n=1 Tax=Picea glauca TaxID=3330 RepID=A0A117NI87_PICGL|nr:hypothetical protein ABT39_MTgene2807 [Picea glauca]QHR87660.1 hypothetical protein Q903MT_gene1672 [Picea sitchensis]
MLSKRIRPGTNTRASPYQTKASHQVLMPELLGSERLRLVTLGVPTWFIYDMTIDTLTRSLLLGLIYYIGISTWR